MSLLLYNICLLTSFILNWYGLTSAEEDDQEGWISYFPQDLLFTFDQLGKGAIIFHVIGVIYSFTALCIVCDKFFVPSLDVIIKKLNIPSDVAGATFMAVGVGAPGLVTSFTSVFAVSFYNDDRLVIGAATFKILFVIGLCSLLSKTVLRLTWWPLFRDCIFYSISIIALVLIFLDDRVFWWEAGLLLCIYAVYVTFMRWNEDVEKAVKRRFCGSSNVQRISRVTDQLMVNIPSASNGDEQTAASVRNARGGCLVAGVIPVDHANKEEIEALNTECEPTVEEGIEKMIADTTVATLSENTTCPVESGDDKSSGKPFDLSWPQGLLKRVTYILLAPIQWPLWLTLPNSSTSRGKRFFVVSFVGSTIWIVLFSSLMNWCLILIANLLGPTLHIPPEVMGLTLLAAGRCSPILITSVIVTRKKGLGDMAVSSSIGSNIFDICVILPLPWFLYSIINWTPVLVESSGMVCSVLVLLVMLFFVVLSMACCFRWMMKKALSIVMLLFYLAFVAISVVFIYEFIRCPL